MQRYRYFLKDSIRKHVNFSKTDQNRGIDEVTGGSPYGASTIAGGHGERMPSENELNAARFQGKHVADITAKLIR